MILSKVDQINIVAPELGIFKERTFSLKYDPNNFVFNLSENGVIKTTMTEREVISNIENGLYKILN